jgi:hypothetical protein
MTRMFAEVLESRRFLSAAVGPATVFDAAVRADELHVYEDFKKFNTDGVHCNTALLRDAKQIRSSNLTQAPSAKSPLATFLGALLPANAELKSDNLKETPAVVNDEKAIIAEQRKLAHDQGNASAVTADQAQLLTDRKQVQTDLENSIETRVTDRENLYNALLQDASNLYGAVSSDTQPSAKLAAAGKQLNTDATNCGTTLSADLQQLETDAQQFDTDLTASQSQ